MPEDSLVLAVMGLRKTTNEKYNFADNLINKIGYPYWHKSIVINKVGTATRTLTDSTNTVFIPFVMDIENTVNTTLVINTSPSDTNFHFIADWQYRNYIYGQPAADTTAENVALLFMLLDRNVFGYEKFIITDSNLFSTTPGQPDLNDREIRINTPNTGRISTSYVVTVCNNTYHCGSQVCRGRGWCDYDSGCPTGVCWPISSVCLEYIYETDPGGGNNGSGGSGGSWSGGNGGSNPNWTPPNCPYNQSLDDPPECQPGWNPPTIIISIEDPCDASDIYSGATATLQYSSVLRTTVQQFTPFDPNTTTQDEQYFIVNDINGSYVPGPIQNLSTSGGSMQGITSSTVMVVHTHPYGGYPFPSPADFFGLANFSSNFMMHYVIGYDGTKYAMVINNYSQLQAFVNANPNAIGSGGGFNLNTTLGLQWVTMRNRLEAQGYSVEEARERSYAYIMKQAGVTLVKAPVGSDTFKKIGIKQQVDQGGNPVVNSNGEPLYENADCN